MPSGAANVIYTIDRYWSPAVVDKKRHRRRNAVPPEPEGRAKVFWTGRSQAVRLPRAFRVATREVSVRRRGEALVLEPVQTERDENGWPLAFWALAGAAPAFDVGDRRRPHERKNALDE
jgi:virulence-associated protein VagC